MSVIHDYISYLKIWNKLHRVERLFLSPIFTIEANVCLPLKLAIFRVNGKTEKNKMDFL